CRDDLDYFPRAEGSAGADDLRGAVGDFGGHFPGETGIWGRIPIAGDDGEGGHSLSRVADDADAVCAGFGSGDRISAGGAYGAEPDGGAGGVGPKADGGIARDVRGS